METLNHPEINMNDFCYFPCPGYIVTMNENILVFANNAALAANEKTFDEFVGENVATLHFPEELEKLKKFLRMDKQLTNYEWKAMNWYKDGKDWRRKALNVVTDIEAIEFGGKTCRLGIDFMVEETHRFID